MTALMSAAHAVDVRLCSGVAISRGRRKRQEQHGTIRTHGSSPAGTYRGADRTVDGGADLEARIKTACPLCSMLCFWVETML